RTSCPSLTDFRRPRYAVRGARAPRVSLRGIPLPGTLAKSSARNIKTWRRGFASQCSFNFAKRTAKNCYPERSVGRLFIMLRFAPPRVPAGGRYIPEGDSGSPRATDGIARATKVSEGGTGCPDRTARRDIPAGSGHARAAPADQITKKNS